FLGLPGHRVEDALARLQLAHLRRGLGLGPLQKHPAENVRRLFFARNHHARSRPRKAAHALLHVHTQCERRKPREMPDALADVLVERDGVAETGAARMWRGREKAVVRRMPAVHVRMPHAAEDGEIIAMLLEHFEVRRQRIIAPALLRKELFRQKTEIVADAKHPTRFSARRSPGDYPL